MDFLISIFDVSLCFLINILRKLLLHVRVNVCYNYFQFKSSVFHMRDNFDRGECTHVEINSVRDFPVEIIVYKSRVSYTHIHTFLPSLRSLCFSSRELIISSVVDARAQYTRKSCAAAVKVLSERPLADNRDIISCTECQRR